MDKLKIRHKVVWSLKNTPQHQRMWVTLRHSNELSMKKGFDPDIIFVDYLNICASSRYKGTIVNSYTYVKAIAEELRGMAGEYNVPVVSATQTTRNGYGNSDVELTDTSESLVCQQLLT